MVSSCLVCRRPLGHNHTLAHLPTGRRIAFELTHGRLWVVCHRCGAWNLTPLEDRWEALEECEHLFTQAPARTTAADIGLAQLADGVELIRIGAQATRNDIANCRYGRRLHRRRGWFLYGVATLIGLALAALTAIHFSFQYILLVAWGAAFLAVWVITLRDFLSGRLLWFRFRSAVPGIGFRVADVPRVALRRKGRNSPTTVLVPGRRKETTFAGEQAAALLATVLPHVNWRGGTPHEIQAALRLVEVAEASVDAEHGPWERILQGTKSIALTGLATSRLLALEMAVTEARELQALQGQAIRLRPDWQAAEKVAVIADDLLIPDIVRGWLANLKKRQG